MDTVGGRWETGGRYYRGGPSCLRADMLDHRTGGAGRGWSCSVAAGTLSSPLLTYAEAAQYAAEMADRRHR
jgi:hypothetical protein